MKCPIELEAGEFEVQIVTSPGKLLAIGRAFVVNGKIHVHMDALPRDGVVILEARSLAVKQ